MAELRKVVFMRGEVDAMAQQAFATEGLFLSKNSRRPDSVGQMLNILERFTELVCHYLVVKQDRLSLRPAGELPPVRPPDLPSS